MPFDPDRPLVFMHVAKSSGTSLDAGLTDALSPKRRAGGFDEVMFGGFTDFATLSDEARAQIHPTPWSLPDADYVHGHLSLSTTLARYPHAQFITVLREPTARLLSHHRYWQSRTATMMRGWGRWARVVHRARQPLETFLRDPWAACQTDNMTLRMLLWPHPLIPAHGFIERRHDAQLLREARARLARFDWVDVVENDQLGQNLRDWLRRPFRHRRLNEASGHPPRDGTAVEADLSDSAFDLLEHRSRLDHALWEDVMRARMPGDDPVRVRQRGLLRSVARHAAAARPARATAQAGSGAGWLPRGLLPSRLLPTGPLSRVLPSRSTPFPGRASLARLLAPGG